MAESKYISMIQDWFGVDRERVLDLPISTYLEMVSALDNDDYMALHHLGYKFVWGSGGYNEI